MDRSFEAIVAQERRKGWFVNLAATERGWECRLECGVDVLPAEAPRPRAKAQTAVEAVEVAIFNRNRMLAKQSEQAA